MWDIKYKLLLVLTAYLVLSSFSCEEDTLIMEEFEIEAPAYSEYEEGYYIIEIGNNYSYKKIKQGSNDKYNLMFISNNPIRQLNRTCDSYQTYYENNKIVLEGKPLLDLLTVKYNGKNVQPNVTIDIITSECEKEFPYRSFHYFTHNFESKRDTTLILPVYPDQYNFLRVRRVNEVIYADSIYIGRDNVVLEL